MPPEHEKEAVMPVIVSGRIEGIRTGEFERRKYAALQFVEGGKEDAIRFFEVNLPDNFDHRKFHKGQLVELVVDVRAKESRVSYRYVSQVGKADSTEQSLDPATD